MKAKKLEVVKKWLEPKSVQDIQVFLGFANFYWQFIQGLSRIAAPLTSMLKTAAPLENLISNKLKFGDGEKGDGIGGNGIKIAKKSENPKSQKLSKS